MGLPWDKHIFLSKLRKRVEEEKLVGDQGARSEYLAQHQRIALPDR